MRPLARTVIAGLVALVVWPKASATERPTGGGHRPEVRLIDSNRPLSDAEFVRLRARLKGKPQVVAGRALGTPYKSHRWHGSDFWYYRVGDGILLVEESDGRVYQMGHQKP
jgi:hypothetical protein